VAGDDALNASNMYAYCSGNPVMRVDPSGMYDLGLGTALTLGLLVGVAIEFQYSFLGMDMDQIEKFWLGISSSASVEYVIAIASIYIGFLDAMRRDPAGGVTGIIDRSPIRIDIYLSESDAKQIVSKIKNVTSAFDIAGIIMGFVELGLAGYINYGSEVQANLAITLTSVIAPLAKPLLVVAIAAYGVGKFADAISDNCKGNGVVIGIPVSAQ